MPRPQRLPIPELVLGSTAAGAIFVATTGGMIPGGWLPGLTIGAATGLSLSPIVARALMRLAEPLASLGLVALLTQVMVAWCMARTGNPWLTWGVSVSFYFGLTIIAGRFLPRRPGPIDPSRCAACGYPTTGLRGRTCPECGGALPPRPFTPLAR